MQTREMFLECENSKLKRQIQEQKEEMARLVRMSARYQDENEQIKRRLERIRTTVA